DPAVSFARLFRINAHHTCRQHSREKFYAQQADLQGWQPNGNGSKQVSPVRRGETAPAFWTGRDRESHLNRNCCAFGENCGPASCRNYTMSPESEQHSLLADVVS